MGIGDIGYGLKTWFKKDVDNVEQEISSDETKLVFLQVTNKDSTDAFIQIFKEAAVDVTVGTTTPDQSYLVPAGDGTLYGALVHEFKPGIDCENGLTIACTTTEDGAIATSTALIVNILYLGGG